MMVVQVEVVSSHGVRDSTGIGPSAILLVIGISYRAIVSKSDP